MTNKQEIIDKFKISPKDKGGAPVQIALLTAKIKDLSRHFSLHKKDFHSMRGLMKKVSQRKKLLSYIKRKNKSSYEQIVKSLSLRK